LSDARTTQPVRVQILDASGRGPRVTFRLPVVRIGRDPGCEICLDDPAVSRVHCAIHRQGERAILVVGHSRNPTFVNGMKASNVELRPGDTLAVCDHKLKFDPPEEGQSAEGPQTLDHLGSHRKTQAPGSGGALKAVLVADDGEDAEDGDDLLELDLGRPDEEHTRVMPRSKVRPPEEKTRVMPPSGMGEVVARKGPGRSDDEHTRILPKGPKKPTQPGAVILSTGAPAQPDPQGQPVDLDPGALSVAIQEQSTAPQGEAEEKPKKGPLQSNAVRAALLLLMIVGALFAWKDTLFGTQEEMPTTRRAVAADIEDLVVERDGRGDAELVADAKKSYDVGCKKMEEHHLQDENLTMAIRKLNEAHALLLLLPKAPALLAEIDLKLKEAEDLREEKYRDALFHYQKLKRSGDYRGGQEELEYIMRLIADESDPRYQDAAKELVMIEQAMKDRRR
jgi:hypothetical protein